MKLPNKAIMYNESVLSNFPIILSILSRGDISVADLFLTIKNQIEDISDFVDTLDCLYALGKINFNSETRRITYVI